MPVVRIREVKHLDQGLIARHQAIAHRPVMSSPRRGSVQVQLLGKLSELIGRDASVQVVLALVVQQVLEPDPPVPADPTEGDLSGLKQADQVRTRDVEHVCGLLGAELHFLREDLNPAALRQQIEDLGEHDCCWTRDDQGILGSDFPDGLNEVVIWVPFEVLVDAPRGTIRDLSVNVLRVDRADTSFEMGTIRSDSEP